MKLHATLTIFRQNPQGMPATTIKTLEKAKKKKTSKKTEDICLHPDRNEFCGMIFQAAP